MTEYIQATYEKNDQIENVFLLSSCPSLLNPGSLLVVDAGLWLPVPQADLHASWDVDGQTTLELGVGLQPRLKLDDLKWCRRENRSENTIAACPSGPVSASVREVWNQVAEQGIDN